jgi:xylulose-5-phosphate/fructose-6-phosphate phosphoketolase
MEALKRVRRKPPNTQAMIDECRAALERHGSYIEEHLDDIPEVRDWTWSEP